MRNPKARKKRIGMIVGLHPSSDGHTRITRTDESVVVGGNDPCHERAAEVQVRLEEGLKGKPITDCSPAELAARIAEAEAKVR